MTPTDNMEQTGLGALSGPAEPPRPGAKTRKPRAQVGALPFRRDADERLHIMLITSRETRRWVIPKGWPMRGIKPHRAAEREAFEEAGLKGKIDKAALGTYVYEKRLENGDTAPVEVSVFAFRVAGQRKRWPEMDQRDGRWCSPDEAANLVQEEGLRALIRTFDPPPAEPLKPKKKAVAAPKPKAPKKPRKAGKRSPEGAS